jgi:hypothetical protein
MCFSATASFVASGALILIGAATYVVARRKDKVLVAIPILFGIQQFFEGIQWLHLGRGSTSLFAAYGFLLFALIVWPAYVPIFVFLLDKKRRKVMAGFAALGVAVALYFAGLLMLESVRIRERHACVNYYFNFPYKWAVLFLYLVATLGPLLASSRPIFRWFGLAIGAMSVVAWWVYKVNFLSVWCFFSAGVSAMFFLYVQRKRSHRPHAT